MVGSLGEGTSRWWGIWVRGPAHGGGFERGGPEQLVGNLNLSEGAPFP